MLRLTRELRHQSISKRDDSSEEDDPCTVRRRSARLNPKQEQECIHDSGTESDEDELEEIAQKSLMAKSLETFLTESPPILSSSPPTTSDIDTESWDSFGHESGIMTGDGDSNSDGDECSTPRPRRRMHDGAFSAVKFPKMKCEFPYINVCESIDKPNESSEESKDNGPIASRLRSNNDSSREIIVAARRAPVRLLINRPYWRSKGSAVSNEVALAPTTSFSETSCPVAKKSRCNSWRPCLDLDKMIRNRISSESARCVANRNDQYTQDH